MCLLDFPGDTYQELGRIRGFTQLASYQVSLPHLIDAVDDIRRLKPLGQNKDSLLLKARGAVHKSWIAFAPVP